MKLEGIYTALVTPFDKELNICFESLENLIQQQLKGKVDGFVLNGTTGESPTLTAAEVRSIYKFVRDKVPKGFPLILGVGSNSTQKTIENILFYEDLGADAYLVVTPYYNKPPQRGLVNHFTQVSKATEKPIILYDVPGRTITSIHVETVKKLSELSNVVAIKDATGDLSVLDKLLAEEISEFSFLSGDDGSTCGYVNKGGHGVISVISHIIPEQFRACMEQKEDFQNWEELCEQLFVEANPIPVKWALYKMGVINTPHLRAPLCDLDAVHKDALEKLLKEKGLLG